MRSLLISCITVLLYSCTSINNKESKPNTLTDAEVQDGWQLLFNGESTDGWHLYNKGKVPSAWLVKDGELFCDPDTFEVEHGDLVSDKEFKNYQLKFEWNISTAGNSGVFINVKETEENPTAWTSGPEYQLLDNLGIHKEYLIDSTKWAGCLYGFHPNLNSVQALPAGNWNSSEITQENGIISFWLNGVKTAEQDFTSNAWTEMVTNSGFKTFPNFGKSTDGHIVLQDWSKGVKFRNIKIKEL